MRDLAFRSGRLRISVLGPDGKPRRGVQVHVSSPHAQWGITIPLTDENGRAEATSKQGVVHLYVWPRSLTTAQAKRAFFEEGISSSRIYLRPGREAVGAILIEMLTGLKSAFTYTGARTCEEFHDRAVVGIQTTSGFTEGTPHGVVRR